MCNALVLLLHCCSNVIDQAFGQGISYAKQSLIVMVQAQSFVLECYWIEDSIQFREKLMKFTDIHGIGCNLAIIRE